MQAAMAIPRIRLWWSGDHVLTVVRSRRNRPMSNSQATSSAGAAQRFQRASGARLIGATALARGLSLTSLSAPTWAQTAEQLEKQYGLEAMEHALETKRQYDLYGIRFDFDSATIQGQTEPLLNDIATALKSFPNWRLRITGHTDSTGDPAHNALLSRERASAVK